MRQTARLVLADGREFIGRSFGAQGETRGEVVFNTSMSGYQEMLTDPSYVGQILTMSYPHIGSVGANIHDEESSRVHAVGLVVRESSTASNFRSEESLDAYLKKNNVVGIDGIDTRALVRHLRIHGSQSGVVSTENVSTPALVERAKSTPTMEGRDLASEVSTPKAYTFEAPAIDVLEDKKPRTVESRFRVVAIDYGLKKNMLECLRDAGCAVTVVPSKMSAQEVLKLSPDGIFLTNGPGDPAAVRGARETVAELVGKKPLFGICLGHQILALALGAQTYKMKFGHRGANQPVKDLLSGKIEITSQNHGFAVDVETVKKVARMTHLNLNDGTCEGIDVPDGQAMSVQYHPESSPGPHDARYLFSRFVKMLEQKRRA